MSIKKLFDSPSKNLNYSDYQDEKTAYELVESRKNVTETQLRQKTTIPRVDYSEPATFAKFGSARLYYQAALSKIIDYYPYDGSHYEKEKFYNSLFEIEKYIIDFRYPKTTGYVNMSVAGWGALNGSVTSDGYGAPTVPEYITFMGGPGTGSINSTKISKLSPNEYSNLLNRANIYDENIYQTEGYSENFGSGTRLSNLRSNFDDGVTIEFWLKKDAFDNAKTSKEVVLDLWNNYATSSNSYGRVRVELTGGGADPADPTNQSPIFLTVESGSHFGTLTGFSGRIGSGLTTTSLQTWSHYAISLKNNEAEFQAKLYVNGSLYDTNTYPINIKELNSKNMMGRIGALQTSPVGSTAPAGAGKLSASLDEFRFWKEARNSRLIDFNWFDNVDGGTNTDISNTTLGVYYKFNEGITHTASTDSIVLDYAGRVTNGVWTGYVSAASRNTGSAMVSASATKAEHLDPIVRSDNPLYRSLKTELKNKGTAYDGFNNSRFVNYAPNWVLEEHEKTGNENLDYIAQVAGAYMDRVYLLASEIPKLKQVTYLSSSGTGSQTPYAFSQHLPQSLGLYVPEIFVDAKIYEKLYSRSSKEEFESKLVDIKNIIYQNLYNNLSNIYKTKGTEKAIRNVFRCFDIDDSLVKFKSYADGTTYELKNNLREFVLDADRISFNRLGSTAGVIYQKTDSTNSDSSGYISGSYGSALAGVENPYGVTIAASTIFPRFYKKKDSLNRTETKISLFGVHTVDTGSADSLSGENTTLVVNDYANFQVYAVRDRASSRNVKFVLSSSGPYPIPEISSSTFFSVYSDNKWDLSVRLKPSNYPFSGLVTGSETYTYDVIFRGVSSYLGTVGDSFEVSSSITFAAGSKFLQSPKRIYAGARRTNITGAVLQTCDVLLDGVRYWTKYISNGNIDQHSFERDNSGVSGSSWNISPLDNNGKNQDLRNINTLALDWNFANVTGSDSSGNFSVQDFSSGSVSSRENFSWLGKISGYQHSGYGNYFPASSTDIVDKSLVTTFKFMDPEEAVSSNMINILSEDEQDQYFETFNLTPDYIFTVEKSMYNAISDEINQFLAGVADYNDLIGMPVNRYRTRYKDMELLREMFFRRVTKVSNVEKFVEYYKWFDDSITTIISQLMPASAHYTNDLLNTVESHALERNKYETKFPTLEFKEPKIPDGVMYGWTEMNYPYALGSSPLETTPGNRDVTKHWPYWNRRAERTANEISSSDMFVNDDRDEIRNAVNTVPTLSQSGYTVREIDGTEYKTQRYARSNFPKVYNFDIEDKQNEATFVIHGGVNFAPIKNIGFTYSALYPGGPIDTAGGRFVPQNILVSLGDEFEKFPLNNDPLDPRNKKVRWHTKVHMGREYEEGIGYHSVKSDMAFPFNIISSSLASGYQAIVQEKLKIHPAGAKDAFYQNIEITNLHNDVYGPMMEKPMQGPFTERFVGGHQSRHVALNKGTDTWYNRPEAWYLLLGACAVNVSGAIGMVGPDYPWPNPENTWATPAYPATGALKAPYYRDFVAKRPVNIKNIRMGTGSAPAAYAIGNYAHNYQVVHTFGAYSNPRQFVEQQPVIPAVVSAARTVSSSVTNTILDIHRISEGHFQFVPDYSTSYRTSSLNRTVISTIFNSPGGMETSAARYKDWRASEFSVYNVHGYKNLTVLKPQQIASGSKPPLNAGVGTPAIRVRDIHGSTYGLNALQARHCGKFGRDSLYVTSSNNLPGKVYAQTGSFQKNHRNTFRNLKIIAYNPTTDTNTVGPNTEHDNFYVGHQLPRSTMNYRWISSSFLTTSYGYGYAPASGWYWNPHASPPPGPFTDSGSIEPAITFKTSSAFKSYVQGGQRFFGADSTTLSQMISTDFVGLNLNIVQSASVADVWPYMTLGNYTRPTTNQPAYLGISGSEHYLNKDFVDGGFQPAASSVPMLNAILLNRGSMWGLSSWAQSRFADHRLVQKYRKSNMLLPFGTGRCVEADAPYDFPAVTVIIAPTAPEMGAEWGSMPGSWTPAPESTGGPYYFEAELIVPDSPFSPGSPVPTMMPAPPTGMPTSMSPAGVGGILDGTTAYAGGTGPALGAAESIFGASYAVNNPGTQLSSMPSYSTLEIDNSSPVRSGPSGPSGPPRSAARRRIPLNAANVTVGKTNVNSALKPAGFGIPAAQRSSYNFAALSAPGRHDRRNYGSREFAFNQKIIPNKMYNYKSDFEQLLLTTVAQPQSAKLNWVLYPQSVFPSSRWQGTTKITNKPTFNNKYWRSTQISRKTGSTNAFGVTYAAAVSLGQPPISQSIFCLDPPSDFLTRARPPDCISASFATVQHTRRSIFSSGAAGQLQNTYSSYYTGSNMPTLQVERVNKMGAGPLYSRKQTLSNPMSLVSRTGPVIPQTNSVGHTTAWKPTKSIKIFGGEAVFQPELAGIIIRHSGANNVPGFVSYPSEPWYDNYQAFLNDNLKYKSRTLAILPEYRISEHIGDYLSYGKRNISKNDEYEIPETGINNLTESFFTTYSNSDFLGSMQRIAQQSQLSPSEIRLTCRAAIKFNPYKGFYPAQRTVQLVEKFNEVYKDNLMGVKPNGSVNKLDASDNNFSIARCVVAPLFAPGILYNSIKSAVAVDYPVIGSISKKTRMQFSGNFVPNNWALNIDVTSANLEFNDDIVTLSSSFWDQRLPFETIIYPENINNTVLLDLESHPSATLDSSDTVGLGATISPAPVSEEYSLMMRNFLGAVPDFFLDKSEFTKLESNVIPGELRFKQGEVYISRLKFYRSVTGAMSYNNELPTNTAITNSYSDFGMKPYINNAFLPATNNSYIEIPQNPQRSSVRETLTTYSRTTAFGPPVAGTLSTPEHMSAYETATVYDSFTGYNPAFTDASRDGEGWVDFIFRPSGSSIYDVEKILAETEMVHWRFDPGYIISGSTQLIYDAHVSGSGQNGGQLYYYTASAAPYSGRVINQNSMQVSASFNLLGVERVQFAQEDNLTGQGSKRNTSVGQKWVIQPKFETPLINFSDFSIRPLDTSLLNLPSYAPESVPRGIWHQFGTIPRKNEGLYVEFSEPSTDWLRYHYDVRTNNTAYNNYDASTNGKDLWQKTKSFKDLFGFQTKQKSTKLGKLKETLTVKEAIVAVPYIESRCSELTRASNVVAPTVSDKSKQFISLPMDRVEATLDQLIGTPVGDSLSLAGMSIREQLTRMQDFVLPPQFDFLQDRSLKPVVMYIIPFEYTLDKDDLSYIWQNMAPRKYKELQFQEQSVCHMLANNELFSKKNILDNDKLRWMVFKVKQKVQSDYYDKVVAQSGQAPSDRFLNKTDENNNLKFNWPYDYLSFIEMASMDVEVLFKPNDSSASIQRRKLYDDRKARSKMKLSFNKLSNTGDLILKKPSSMNMSTRVPRKDLSPTTDGVTMTGPASLATPGGTGNNSGGGSNY